MVFGLEAPSVPALMRGEGDAFRSSPPACRTAAREAAGGSSRFSSDGGFHVSELYASASAPGNRH